MQRLFVILLGLSLSCVLNAKSMGFGLTSGFSAYNKQVGVDSHPAVLIPMNFDLYGEVRWFNLPKNTLSYRLSHEGYFEVIDTGFLPMAYLSFSFLYNIWDNHEYFFDAGAGYRFDYVTYIIPFQEGSGFFSSPFIEVGAGKSFDNFVLRFSLNTNKELWVWGADKAIILVANVSLIFLW